MRELRSSHTRLTAKGQTVHSLCLSRGRWLELFFSFDHTTLPAIITHISLIINVPHAATLLGKGTAPSPYCGTACISSESTVIHCKHLERFEIMSLLSWNSLLLLVAAMATSAEASWLPPRPRMALTPARLSTDVPQWGLTVSQILRGGSTGTYDINS